MPVSAELSISI